MSQDALQQDTLTPDDTLTPERDAVDEIVAQWHVERPELDPSGKHITGRIVRLASLFLQAFEGFCTRPHEVAPGDWLESLIDPAVRALSEELDNLSFVRSLREVEPRAPWSRCRASRPRPSTW